MSILPALSTPQFIGGPSPWQEQNIEDFSGGLCTSMPESKIADNQFVALNNYYVEQDGSIKARGPYRPYLVTSVETVLTTAPLSFRWIELSGTDYLLSYRTNTLAYWTGSAWQTITADTTPSSAPQFIPVAINDQNEVVICDGNGTPQRWSAASSTCTDLGLTAPSLGLAAGSDAGIDQTRGLSTGGTYYYKFTYWYAASSSTKYGESNPSTSISVTVTAPTSAGNYRVVSLTDLPAISGDVSRIYIYRSPVDNSSGPYRKVGYITTGTTFTDNTPEGEEEEGLPIDAGTVPSLKNTVFFKGRLWGVDGSLNNKGIYSAPGNADVFPALNYAYFPDELIGPVPFKENVYWFTTKQIYVTPNGDVDTYPEPIKICDKSCTSYQSIVDVGNGLVFQGEDNIYWVDFNIQSLKDGEYPIPIGEPIKNKIKDIPVLRRVNSRAYLYNDRYYLCYTGVGQTVNTATLVWNVPVGTALLHQRQQFGGWSSLDWKANDIQNYKGTLYTADNTNKYIMEHDWAGVVDYHSKTEYDASTSYSIPAEVKTKRFHFGHEWAEKIIRSLSIVTETSGVTYNATLSINYRDFERTQSFTLGSGTPSYATDWLIWGQGTWGNFNWGGSTYQIYSSHAKFGQGAKGRNAQLDIATANVNDTNLILLKLFYKTKPPPT